MNRLFPSFFFMACATFTGLTSSAARAEMHTATNADGRQFSACRPWIANTLGTIAHRIQEQSAMIDRFEVRAEEMQHNGSSADAGRALVYSASGLCGAYLDDVTRWRLLFDRMYKDIDLNCNSIFSDESHLTATHVSNIYESMNRTTVRLNHLLSHVNSSGLTAALRDSVNQQRRFRQQIQEMIDGLPAASDVDDTTPPVSSAAE